LYVFTASGFNIVSGVPQPKAIVELIRFFRDGTLDAPGGTVSINGSINPIPIPGQPGLGSAVVNGRSAIIQMGTNRIIRYAN